RPANTERWARVPARFRRLAWWSLMHPRLIRQYLTDEGTRHRAPDRRRARRLRRRDGGARGGAPRVAPLGAGEGTAARDRRLRRRPHLRRRHARRPGGPPPLAALREVLPGGHD